MTDDRDPAGANESSRRAFIQRMVAAGFAGPVIGSFSFSELATASGPRHTFPNQYHANQSPKCDDDDDDHGKDQGDQGQGDQGDHGKDHSSQGDQGDHGKDHGNQGDQHDKHHGHH